MKTRIKRLMLHLLTLVPLAAISFHAKSALAFTGKEKSPDKPSRESGAQSDGGGFGK